MRRILLPLVVPALLLVSGPPWLRAADSPETAFIKSALGKAIVGKTLPMAEVQRYCEARVVRMPAVKTAAEWEAEASRLRAAVLQRVVFRGEAAKWRDAACKVQWLGEIPAAENVPQPPGYRIKRLRYEALPGMWIPALLYEPEKLAGKVPVVLNVNGHVGDIGKAYIPKQIRCINQAKKGMIALNVEWLAMGQLGAEGFQHYRMNQLDLCGTSGVAPHYLAMKRGLDILLSLEHADPSRVAVTGLSGGGWQTIFISGLDTRVTFSNPVAGYSSFRTRANYLSDLGDSEQTPTDLGMIADYCHLTAMRAPRPTLLTKNSKDDCCFASAHALPPLLEAAKPVFRLYGKDNALRSHVNDNPGTHNYEIDNRQAFYGMAGDFFYPGSKEYDPKEIPSDKEVKTKQQLEVPMPDKNEDFHSLAMAISKSLPREAYQPPKADLPKDKAAAAAWQKAGRARFREIVRAKDYQVHAIASGSEEKEGVKATFWRLQMGAAWTVPAVELARADAKKTAILVADNGRASTADHVQRLLAAGYRVLAVDPFYFGESKIAERDFLFALLVAAVGDRPLGLQASQVAAIARWAAGERNVGPVTVVAVGPRSSTFALVAAALEEKAIAGLELHNPLASLKEIIEQNATVEQKPELFCFGLLEWFDVKHLAAMVAPRRLTIRAASPRAQAELAGWADM